MSMSEQRSRQTDVVTLDFYIISMNLNIHGSTDNILTRPNIF